MVRRVRSAVDAGVAVPGDAAVAVEV
jgi:hypothetical protein